MTTENNGAVQKATPLNIGEFLKSKKDDIQKVAGQALNAETLLRVALNSIIKNPKLGQCTQASVLLSVMDAAAFGLFPNSLTNEGHLVPFYSNKEKTHLCQFMVGYKGLLKMANNSGAIAGVDVRAVYENDEFAYGYGLVPYLNHVPASGERGAFAYAYAIVRYKEPGSTPSFEVINSADAEAHGKRFSKSKNKSGQMYGPWADDLEAMAMKTVLRKALKYVPLSTKSEKLAEIVHRDEYQEAIDIDLTPATEIQEPMPITDGFEKKEETVDDKTDEIKTTATEDEINAEFERASQEGLFEERAGAKFNDQ